MFAVRIEDIIDNNDLVIPFEKLKIFNHQDVEVIILPKLRQVKNLNTKVGDILSKYKNIHPFDKIEDSVEWQRELRNEW